MTEYRHMGYIIRQSLHPTPINPQRTAWDIYDGTKLRKQNISSVEVARHVIDTMIKYGYWRGAGYAE